MQIAKLKAMVHFICTEFQEKRDKLNRTKLMKILWFSDGEYLRQTGETISGFDAYLKYPNGPFLTEIYDAEEHLEKSNYIKLHKDMKEVRYILRVLYKKNLYENNFLNQKERKIISEWVTMLSGETAKSVSEISHEYWWNDFKDKASIPVYMRIPMVETDNIGVDVLKEHLIKMVEEHKALKEIGSETS